MLYKNFKIGKIKQWVIFSVSEVTLSLPSLSKQFTLNTKHIRYKYLENI